MCAAGGHAARRCKVLLVGWQRILSPLRSRANMGMSERQQLPWTWGVCVPCRGCCLLLAALLGSGLGCSVEVFTGIIAHRGQIIWSRGRHRDIKTIPSTNGGPRHINFFLQCLVVVAGRRGAATSPKGPPGFVVPGSPHSKEMAGGKMSCLLPAGPWGCW